MSNIETSRIHKIDVGTPPSSTTSDSGWEIIQVHYHDFKNLTTTRGEAVVSSEFTCFGHQWRLRVFPGGNTNSGDGMVSIFLFNMSNKSITLQYGFSVKNKVHKSRIEFASQIEGDKFAPYGERTHSAYGWNCYGARSTIIDHYLVNGTLIIEVRMRNVGEKTTSLFIPDNPISKNILSKFMDEESADVVFEVDSESEDGKERACKRAKTTTAFYAHRLILQDGATTLAEMCKSGEKSNTTLSITDVTPEIFRHLLYYVYGGKVSDEDLKNNARDIIDAADKYGVVNLKLEAEASLVTSTTITIENMLDNLLYASSKNCALLQEAVLDFVVENSDEVSDKVSLEDVPSSILADLVAAMSRKYKGGKRGSDVFSTMRVSELRKKLNYKGLDIDGSRKAMIATLKEHKES